MRGKLTGRSLSNAPLQLQQHPGRGMSDGLLLSCAKKRRFLPVSPRPRPKGTSVMHPHGFATQEAARFLRFFACGAM